MVVFVGGYLDRDPSLHLHSRRLEPLYLEGVVGHELDALVRTNERTNAPSERRNKIQNDVMSKAKSLVLELCGEHIISE